MISAQDLAILQSWSFLADYTRNRARARDACLDVAKAVYQALRTHNQGAPIVPNGFVRPLAAALRANVSFQAMCQARGHASPSLHPVFALAMAQYIVDFEWNQITSP
jgi:hypothetical protein